MLHLLQNYNSSMSIHSNCPFIAVDCIILSIHTKNIWSDALSVRLYTYFIYVFCDFLFIISFFFLFSFFYEHLFFKYLLLNEIFCFLFSFFFFNFLYSLYFSPYFKELRYLWMLSSLFVIVLNSFRFI